MEYIRWKEELSVGMEFIDNQHKQLFHYINAFYEGIVNKSNKEAMMKVIKNLEDYTITHFSEEETLMRKANYLYYLEHKSEHQKFIEKVSDFRKRYDEGRLLISLEVTAFIKDWITNHIMKTDQMYKGKL